jgi:hypothetical protein
VERFRAMVEAAGLQRPPQHHVRHDIAARPQSSNGEAHGYRCFVRPRVLARNSATCAVALCSPAPASKGSWPVAA